MASSFVYVTEEELFFNKQSHRFRHYHKSNEIWPLSIQRYVFLLLFSDKCTQYERKMFCLQGISGRQADLFGKIVLQILKTNMWKQLCKVYAE